MTSTKSTSNTHIVKTREKRVEVMASPGSGKTHTLIERLIHLLFSGVSGSKILVLSFSNASVRELERRMQTQQQLASEV